MKKKFSYLSILLALVILTASFAACGNKDGESNSSITGSSNNSTSSNSNTDDSDFDYSGILTDTGYIKDVTAKDLVKMADYKSLKIPSADVTASENDIQTEIDMTYLTQSTKQITDRAVVDGDTVNIDYVGSTDGVEFSGGSTGGAGTEVTIGVTSYIDDFLEQLIGHKPGETFDVNVTFPDSYPNNPDLQGKEAVFVTTINYIAETVTPELSDSFVEENFSESKGWKTVDAMKASIKEELERKKVLNYVSNYLKTEFTVETIPDEIIKYHEGIVIDYYKGYATYYGVEFDEFLTSYMDGASIEDLLTENSEGTLEEASYVLVIQAIAEELKFVPTEDDVKSYFADIDIDDYSEYEESYGMPYLKQAALEYMVLEYIADNATIS